MLIIYRILINIVFIFSPLIILIRILKNKEDVKRFKEKLCFFSKKRGDGKIIWFHGASVGEIKSIVPILEKLENNNGIRKILITSNTLSSSKIIQQFKLKKIVHQFFPIDTNHLSLKFINHWRPSCAFFVDSEIWPNMFCNLEKKNIPINLINGRITKKTFRNWNLVPNFSKKFFSKFNLCLASSIQSKKFLEKLGVKKVLFLGNLKFAETEKEIKEINKNLKKNLNSKKIWCASSTHETEEDICGKVHIKLKKKHKNLLTIIIPRHVERTNAIISELSKNNLNVQKFSSNDKKIYSNTDIYLIDAYGVNKSFYNYCKIVFVGGSLIKHGGQNPLEAARFGCNILHGPYISNFSDIYKFLKKCNMTKRISNFQSMYWTLDGLFTKKNTTNKTQKKITIIGQNIFKKTYNEINKLLKDEI